MPSEWEHDFAAKHPRKDTSHAAKERRVRALLDSIAWVHAPKAFALGATAALDVRRATLDDVGFTRRRASMALFSIHRADGKLTLERIDRKRIGQCNWALIELGARFDKRQLEADLRRTTVALDALEHGHHPDDVLWLGRKRPSQRGWHKDRAAFVRPPAKVLALDPRLLEDEVADATTFYCLVAEDADVDAFLRGFVDVLRAAEQAVATFDRRLVRFLEHVSAAFVAVHGMQIDPVKERRRYLETVTDALNEVCASHVGKFEAAQDPVAALANLSEVLLGTRLALDYRRFVAERADRWADAIGEAVFEAAAVARPRVDRHLKRLADVAAQLAAVAGVDALSPFARYVAAIAELATPAGAITQAANVIAAVAHASPAPNVVTHHLADAAHAMWNARITPDAIVLTLLSRFPAGVDVGALVESGVFLSLMQLNTVREDSYAAGVAWLSERPGLWPHISSRRYSGLSEIIDDGGRVLLAKAAELYDTLTDDFGVPHKDAGDVIYAGLIEVVSHKQHRHYVERHFSVLKTLALDAIEAGRSFHGELRTLRAMERRAPILRLLSHWDMSGFLKAKEALDRALAFARQREQSHQSRGFPAVEEETELLVGLSFGNPVRLVTLLGRHRLDFGEAEPARAAFLRLNALPAMRKWMEEATRDPGELISLLQRMELAVRLPSYRLLETTLKNFDADAPADATERYRHYRRLARLPDELPSEVQKILERPASLRGELERLAGETEPKKVARREKVAGFLENPAALQGWIDKDVEKALKKHLELVRVEAVSRLTDATINTHWQDVLGVIPDDAGHPNWVNALHLMLSIKTNRRLLKQLLRAVAEKRVLEHPTNTAFAERLRKKGIDIGALHRPRELVLKLAKQKYRAYVVEDPLEVLQMGNLFSTCLSLNGVNAFSTVANAAEINKRVLMLRSEEGHVIGRKLVVMTGSGALLGFNSYGAMGQWSGRLNVDPWVKIIFDQLCLELAEAAGGHLATAVEGEKAEDDFHGLRLFSHWYNDGPEPYDFWVFAKGKRATRDVLRRAFLEEGLTPQDTFKFGAAIRGLLWLQDPRLITELSGKGMLPAPAPAFLDTHARPRALRSGLDRRDFRKKKSRL